MSCCSCVKRKKINTEDIQVIESFKKAIEIYNEKNGLKLELIRILHGTEQVASGFIYEALVEIKENENIKNFNIQVWAKQRGPSYDLIHCYEVELNE